MKLRVFQSGSGDSLLLTGDGPNGPNVLVDGDTGGAYKEHVAPSLQKLGIKNLDLIYISHIDNDHIEGVLQLLDDLAQWRIFNFKTNNGQHPEKHPKPKSVEPPEVGGIWHNAFHDLFGIDSGRVEELLTARQTIFGNLDMDPDNGSGPVDTGLATTQRFISLEETFATGIPQAIRVSYRVSPRQLAIPLNPQFTGNQFDDTDLIDPAFGGTLMRVTPNMPTPIPIGGMSFFLLAPFKEDILDLRAEWNSLLNEVKVEELARKAQQDIDDLHGNEVDHITQAALVQAAALRDQLMNEINVSQQITKVEDLGKRNKVTPPNLASIMVLVEEGGKKVLLTGDGHADDIIRGLKLHQKLDANGRLHVDVLKVQHHGAEFNINKDFCEHITADHYVFCSNGLHENPHPLVLQAIVEARQRANDGLPFTFWFNTPEPSVAEQPNEKGYTKHMRCIAKHVKELAQGMNGLMNVEFRKESFFEIPF